MSKTARLVYTTEVSVTTYLPLCSNCGSSELAMRTQIPSLGKLIQCNKCKRAFEWQGTPEEAIKDWTENNIKELK